METQRIHSGHRQPPSPDTGFNLNINHNKEPMFEKPLTPSDVGKLNRLVIPKQHAEKYFPITGAGGGDTGDLLSFEDESGKLWRFRYSYWNSSQSYVLTKGWSRYVKEKRLDPGDVVSFERDRVDCERMFIGWRRRCAAVPAHDSAAVDGGAQVIGWHGRMFYNAQANYPSHHMPLSLSLQLPYQPDCFHAGGMYENVENYQRGPRRVRLFGVNLECPDESEPSTPDGSSHDEGGQPHHQYMTINFNEMRYHHHHHG